MAQKLSSLKKINRRYHSSIKAMTRGAREKEILDSYVQDSVCGTWEILCRAISENAEELIDIGYPAIGHYKALWTENISQYMSPQNNASPSFKTFKMALITALKNPVPIYRKREF